MRKGALAVPSMLSWESLGSLCAPDPAAINRTLLQLRDPPGLPKNKSLSALTLPGNCSRDSLSHRTCRPLFVGQVLRQRTQLLGLVCKEADAAVAAGADLAHLCPVPVWVQPELKHLQQQQQQWR